MAGKRTLDAFIKTTPIKKPRLTADARLPSASLVNPLLTTSLHEDLLVLSSELPSSHATYAFPIAKLPNALSDLLSTSVPGHEGKAINDAPDLDLLYFQPFIPQAAASALYTFLRASLPFYRVKYSIKRGGHEQEINTPRYTTVFGLDASAYFNSPSDPTILDAITSKPVPTSAYTCTPRPIPECLDFLRRLAEAFTGAEYNFVLVNYYSSGKDSISYHSDDEKFLGTDPTIASLSLGATRDFLMRHKPLARDAGKDATAGIYGNRGTVGKGQSKTGSLTSTEEVTEEEKAIREAHKNPLKMPMAGGDMVVMRGKSQSHWLHSVPKRSGKDADNGRINITFRKALKRGGTENYYQYNVGRGPPMRWHPEKRQMIEVEGFEKAQDSKTLNDKRKDDETWTRKANKYGITFERKWHET